LALVALVVQRLLTKEIPGQIQSLVQLHHLAVVEVEQTAVYYQIAVDQVVAGLSGALM
jgi:lipoprotein-anchoring transpeptidase ErfK/SrfK